MDFNVKKLAADAGTFLSRAVQFTEEKFGQAEKTELDAHLENLLSKAESTKLWTEKIMKQTEVLLQPNPNTRIEEFVYEKLDRKVPSRINNSEQLGQFMLDAGNDFGPGTAYGSALIKCGENENRIGAAERELIHTAAVNFLSPLRNFLEGDYKTISKERKLLQNKRLDLDAAKARLRKAKVSESRSAQLNASQAEGDNLMVNLSYMLNLLHVKWLKNCLAVSLPCGYGKAALDRGLPQIQLPLALASFTVASFMFNLLCISKVIVIPLVQILCTSQSYFLSFMFYFLRLRHKCMVGGMCVLYKSTCPSCRTFHSHFNERPST